MTVQESIELYAESCRTRQLSPTTINHDTLVLPRFVLFCQINHLDDLRNATTQTILDYQRWLRHRKRPDGEPLSQKYQNRHVRVLKQVFKLLADRNLIMKDIGRDLPPLHDPKTLPKGIMNKEQAMKLLQQSPITTPLGFRDRAIMEVLYSTGLRAGELCRLTLYDLDLQTRMIRVLKGKGKKDRVVPIGKVACGYLSEYIKTVRSILACPEPGRRDKQNNSLVFLSVTGHKLWTHDLGRIIKTYRDKAGLPENITTHSLRHSWATEMLKGGASIRHVQELLGHANITTTQIYTHVVGTDLKKAHARTAPSERRQVVDPIEFNPQTPRWTDNRNAPEWRKMQGREKAKKTRKKRKMR